MGKKVCQAAAWGVILTVVLLAASCTRQAAKTQPVPLPSTADEPESRQALERSQGEDEMTELIEQGSLHAKKAAAHEAAEKKFINEYVHFTFDSSALSDRSRRILRSKADFLHMNPDITITIEGHCDNRGTKAYNIALGERRAESIKIFLVDQGIGANRLNTVSYGEERPIAMGHNEASWAINRRAQFAIN